jgi:hypothetical protein
MKTAPALMSLKTFKTTEAHGRVFVEIPEDQLTSASAPTNSSLSVRRNPANTSHYVIIGGGAAAQTTAETLRRGGFEGRVTLLSNEDQLPYGRTALSKNTQVDASQLLIAPLQSELFKLKGVLLERVEA